MYAAYLASQDRVGAAGLRIKLSLENAGMLEDIPWELIRDPHADYLALSRQTPIVRYPRVLTARPLVEVKLPLRVLVVISSPDDQTKLDVEAEWQALQESTIDVRNRGLLEFERVEDAQLVTLQHKLREGVDYQVFHYIGHAAFNEHSQTGMLAFEDPKTNNTVPVSGEALARELSEENSIRLVVLNACQGARENVSDPFAGIASSIVARGVPAVVAMQFSISDLASRYFSQEFYRALSEGYPIEAAVAEARRTINSSLNNFEWATPVLYLRAPNGVLFPRRLSQPASTGGLRDAIRSPLGILLSLMLVAIIIAGLVVFGPWRNNGGTTTATATPAVPPDVDLVVSDLRFSPPRPVPGQQVTVSMTLTNNGTTDSGPFKWAWFANDNDTSSPSIISGIDNLSPEESRRVKGDFYFGLWGIYNTAAWVNFDNSVPETNFFNNFLVKSTETDAVKPLDVNFTRLPNGNPILDPFVLKGDEFSAWGFHIAPGPGADPNCKDAAVLLTVQDNGNELITGKNGQPNQCTNLPIIFTLDQPVGSAVVQFVANIPATYTLDIFDENNNKLKSVTAQATSPKQQLTIRAPENGNGLSNVRKAILSGTGNASAAVQSVIFTPLNQPLPSIGP